MAAPFLRRNRDCFYLLSQGKIISKLRSQATGVGFLPKEGARDDRTALLQHSFSSSSAVQETINIPDKIVRGPTAVLEALAKTVRSDVNKPVYQSIDDPALVSRSDGLLKNHLAAYDNGKKTAQTMIAKNPEYYTYFWDVPLPQTYDTVFTGYEFQESCEEALLERIHWRKVGDSIDIYKDMKSREMQISQSTLEQFLDLLTVFNHKDPEDISDIAEFIHPKFEMDAPFPVISWEKESLAEEVFDSLPVKSSKAYCSLICGMVENNHKEKAMQLYRDALANNISVDVFTYNALLSIMSLDMESMDEIIQEIEVVLKNMASNNVSPNVETFNAVLKNCRRISRWRGAKKFALSVIAEMKACGIRPSLTTWFEILSIFYYHKDKSPRAPDLFENMLDLMKDEQYICEGPKDVYFFRTAMRVLTTHLPDSKLALKLHGLLKSQKSFDLIGHRQLRYAYFKDLFLLIASVEHTDEVMTIYDSVVPYIFLPPLPVYKVIFENIETFDTYHYIPRLCADLDGSNFYVDKGAIPLYQLMARMKQEPQLQHQFCDIASAFLERWDNTKQNRVPLYLDGAVIGDMILVFLNGDQLEKALSALQVYRNNRILQRNDPSDAALQALTEAVISSNDYESTKDMLTLMNSLECENINSLITKALETFDLTEQERNYLEGLSLFVGSGSSSDSD